MFLDYNSKFNPQNSLEIKDIGNCAIEGVNNDGLYFYLITTTIRGQVTIATCGPVIPDIDELPNGYTCNITNMMFNQNKLKLTISKWLNGLKPGKNKPITEAKQIDKISALDQFRSIKAYYLSDPDLSIRLAGSIDIDEVSEDDDEW